MSGAGARDKTARLPSVAGVLIFEATWTGSLQQKATTLSFAGLFWAVWIAMWLPIVTALLWLVAPVRGVEHFSLNTVDNFLTVALITLVGVLLGAGLSAWGSLQWFRGAGKALPPRKPTSTLADLSQFHQVSVSELASAWKCRRLVIHHDTEGQVVRIEASLPLNEPPRSG